jgi:hypothetical protein
MVLAECIESDPSTIENHVMSAAFVAQEVSAIPSDVLQ